MKACVSFDLQDAVYAGAEALLEELQAAAEEWQRNNPHENPQENLEQV